MTGTPITLSEALDDAMAFARDAWRDAWAPMLATAAGWAMLIIAGHAQIDSAAAGLLQKIGLCLLLFHLPLLGALYRLGVAGPSLRSLGPGGLQIGGVEWRLIGLNAVLAFFFLLACTPALLSSGVFYAALRRFDGVTLGPLGHWEWWFLAAAIVWTATFVLLVYLSGRLALATPLSVDRGRILPWEGWPLTVGLAHTIALSFVIAHAPTLLVWLGLRVFGWIEPSDAVAGLHGAWPLPEAIGAGVLAGVVLAGLQAPLSVGLLTFFYDVLAPLDDRREEIHAEVHVSPQAPEPKIEPPVDPDPQIDPPFSAVEFSPHTGRFSRLTAPWLSEEPTPERYAAFSTPPREPAPAPELGEEEVYPHSVVEYSPHSGRFSRLFSPWLAAPLETAETAAATTAQPVELGEHEPAAAPDGEPLDAVDEPEHAKP